MQNVDVYLILTRNCNLSCSFCIRKNLEVVTSTMNLSDVVKALDIISEAFPQSTLILTGGEPLLHHEIFSIIEYSLKKWDRVVLTSNGSFSTDTAELLKKYLSRNLWLQLSLDGPENEHDNIRGKGSFRKLTNNILSLKSVYSNIFISTTVTTKTIESSFRLAEILNNYKFSFWKVCPEQVENPLSGNFINSTDWNKFAKDILLHCAYPVRIKQFFNFDLMDYALAQDIKPSILNCGCGKSKIYIDSNGAVSLCSCMDFTLGNIFTAPISKLVEKWHQAGRIIPSNDSVCKTCKYMEICNGGCPGYSLKVFGKINMGDIRCPIVCKSIKHG